MENEIIKTLGNDEVVRFIADRHGIDAQSLVRMFLADDWKEATALLDNEVAILQGLIYKQIEALNRNEKHDWY